MAADVPEVAPDLELGAAVLALLGAAQEEPDLEEPAWDLLLASLAYGAAVATAPASAEWLAWLGAEELEAWAGGAAEPPLWEAPALEPSPRVAALSWARRLDAGTRDLLARVGARRLAGVLRPGDVVLDLAEDAAAVLAAVGVAPAER